ncbi:MAG: hypothetical protein ISS17_07075 [Bacteroidales bacterium]|nr:hypothetical protein [Bacteroidales bacterium]
MQPENCSLFFIELAAVGDLEAAVDEMYKFNSNPFSLISYLMKAQMTGNISPAVMAQILIHIPLPPIPAPKFVPPLKPKPKPVCLCDNPKVKIRITWFYQKACGNYVPSDSGYAANNTLTNISTGRWYCLDGEIHNCICPGGTLKVVEHIHPKVVA